MPPMIGTDEILSRLKELDEAGKIQKKDIAKTLNISPQRITDLFSGLRKLKLDEAQRLVEEFDLEDPAEFVTTIVTLPILAMLFRYALQELAPGVVPDQRRIEDISRDGAAFLRYVADPQIRGNIDLAAAFFLARQAIDQEEAHPTAS